MKIAPNFYIPYHKQLIRESLEDAYLNEFTTFETIKKMVAIERFQNKELKEEDIHYIFDLLVNEGYLIRSKKDINMYYITGKGRIFYLVTFWGP